MNPDYEASNLGNVRRSKDKKPLKQYIQKNGYVNVWLGHVATPVHKIIAWTFCVYVNGADRVDHINTIRSDNRAENLRWVDAKGNSNNDITKKNMSEAQRRRHGQHV